LPQDGGLPDISLVEAPPTRFALGDLGLALRQHGTLDALFERESQRTIHAVMPKVWRNGKEACILLPWDPAYATAPGEGTTQIPVQYLSFPSRLEPSKFVVERPVS
jgi:hypothetical protein